jgi:hypothetical protein
MIAPLDHLIRKLEGKQRVQAQYVEGLSGNGLPAWIQMLRSWPTGAAIVSGAIAILWAVENGQELANKLSDLMAGKAVPLELGQEQQIQQAIESANAKTVAEFRAGDQSDYGLSFNLATSDLALEAVEELPQTWESAVAAESRFVPCGTLRKMWEGKRAELAEMDRAHKTNYVGLKGPAGYPLSGGAIYQKSTYYSANRATGIERLNLLAETGKRYCGASGWSGPKQIKYPDNLPTDGYRMYHTPDGSRIFIRVGETSTDVRSVLPRTGTEPFSVMEETTRLPIGAGPGSMYDASYIEALTGIPERVILFGLRGLGM